jgi:hypothetical protein
MKSLLFLLSLSAFAQSREQAELQAFLTQQAERHWAAREQRLAQLHSRPQIAAWQQHIRDTALEIIGGLPAGRTPLHARVTGKLVRPTCTIEKVLYESQPGFYVTANLYLPHGSGPFPVVLGLAGHSHNGKASEIYQRAFLGFVARGIAVFAYDPPGQGERLEYLHPTTGESTVGIGVGEHLAAGVPTLLTGQTIARHFVWDGIRAIDYLTTRPEIDPTRIAAAGNSGGGAQAAYLALFEPRIRAVVSSCYITRWRELWSGPGPQDSEQIWPGFISRGLDFADFATALAPRPFLITSAIRDYFPIAGARATLRESRRLFDLLGAGQSVDFFAFDDTHGWSQPRREAATRWFSRHLLGQETGGREGDLTPNTDADLQVTPTGQVAHLPAARTMRELALAEAWRLRSLRGEPDLPHIHRVLGYTPPAPAQPVPGDPTRLTVAPGLTVPIHWTQPPNARHTTILLGANPAAAPAGHRLLQFWPRGTGPGFPEPRPTGYSLRYQLAARAWLLGRNFLTWQAQDIVAAVQYVQQLYPGEQVSLLAVGPLGPAALLAAACHLSIHAVSTSQSISSFEDLLRPQPPPGYELAIVPGILQHFDLPHLIRLTKLH